MDDRTGFALCGAGEPNLQFPMGSGIRGQGSSIEIVTCYKCLKLDYINSLEDKQSIPTKDFIPTDKKPILSTVSPETYKRRRKHIMIPFGIEGLFGAEDEDLLDSLKMNTNNIIVKMINNIRADKDLEDSLKNEYIKEVKAWEDFYESISIGDPYSIEIWTRYSPFRVGDKSNKVNNANKMRTQKPRLKASDPLSKITFSEINAVPEEVKESISNRRVREKQAKLQLIGIGIRMLDLIKSGNISQVREMAKRKDKIGSLAKRVLTTQDEKALRFVLQRNLRTVSNPNLMIENDSMAEFESDHQVRKKRVKQRVRRKKS